MEYIFKSKIGPIVPSLALSLVTFTTFVLLLVI